MRVLGIATVDDVKERALDFFGDGATASHVVALAQFNAI
jgi:hypothetical protein